LIKQTKRGGLKMDFQWIAKYKDNSVLKMYSNDKEFAFKDIDQSKLALLYLVPLEKREGSFPIDEEIILQIDTSKLDVEKVEVVIKSVAGGRVVNKEEAVHENGFYIFKRKFFDAGVHTIIWGIHTKNGVVTQKGEFVVLHEKPIVLHFDPSYMRLILLRRHYMRGNEHWLTWLLGWQGTIKGKNIKSILYIQPSGRIDISESFDLSL